MAIQEKAQVVFEARQYDVLIVSVFGKDNFVSVNVVFSGGSDLLGVGDPHRENAEHNRAGNAQTFLFHQLRRKQKSGPQSNSGVDEAKKESGSHQAQVRNQNNWK